LLKEVCLWKVEDAEIFSNTGNYLAFERTFCNSGGFFSSLITASIKSRQIRWFGLFTEFRESSFPVIYVGSTNILWILHRL
jgi:hypothetical protein